jgi:TetR/AcrR family transcriptional repressor of mexJK operon
MYEFGVDNKGGQGGVGLPSRPRGRPKEPALRQRILEAAGELFAVAGYHATAMDAIARQAVVSNRTVYSHFPNKEGVLWAVIEREDLSWLAAIPSNPPDKPRLFQREIIAWGESYLRWLSSPQVMALRRVMISEGTRLPDHARYYAARTLQPIQDRLASWLQHGHHHAWLACRDQQQAAAELLALWQTPWYLPRLLEWKGNLSRKEAQAFAEAGWRSFLRGYRR